MMSDIPKMEQVNTSSEGTNNSLLSNIKNLNTKDSMTF